MKNGTFYSNMKNVENQVLWIQLLIIMFLLFP